MLSFIIQPLKVIKLLESGVSAREVAAGVCLAMFLGFTPLNGPLTILLVIFFFVFKLDKIITVLTLPLFKLFYILGMYRLADALGGYLLIDAAYLTNIWAFITGLPVIALLDLNNTLVTGGLAIAGVLTAPVYFLSKRLAAAAKGHYYSKIKETKAAKVLKNAGFLHDFLNRIDQFKNRFK